MQHFQILFINLILTWGEIIVKCYYINALIMHSFFPVIQGNDGERTSLVVRASDSGSGDPGSILGRVGVLFP